MNKKGFALIELTVVMLLLAVMLSISLPAFKNSLAGTNLHTAARQLAGHIREVQQVALTEEKASYHLVFSLQQNNYLVKDNIKVIKKCYLPVDVNIIDTNFTDNTLRFNAAGRPHPRGGTITLRNSNGELLYVIVAVHSGRVRVDDEPPFWNEIY